MVRVLVITRFLAVLQLYVIKNLKESNIFILVSDNETLGISYIEALASNNIIIAKRNDGIDGIIEDKVNGFLTDPTPSDIQFCIEQILSMNEDEIKKIQLNAQKTMKNLTDKKSAENYIIQIMD